MGQALTVYHGDDILIELAVTNRAGAPVNLTGARINFAVKSDPLQSDISGLYYGTSSDGVSVQIVDAAGGLLQLIVPRASATNMVIGTPYYWAAQLLGLDGLLTTIGSGTLTAQTDVVMAVPT